MKKQEYLDLITDEIEVWATQQMLIGMSKTELRNTLTAFKRVNHVLYRTQARKIPFDKVLESVMEAEKMAREEAITETPENHETMDNDKPVRRSRHGRVDNGTRGETTLPNS